MLVYSRKAVMRSRHSNLVPNWFRAIKRGSAKIHVKECSAGCGGCCRPKDSQVKVFLDCFHFLTLDCSGGGEKKVVAEQEDF